MYLENQPLTKNSSPHASPPASGQGANTTNYGSVSKDDAGLYGWAAWFSSSLGAPQRLRSRFDSRIDHQPAPLASNIDNGVAVATPV